jgi:mono/diheme cytochrome c family protein
VNDKFPGSAAAVAIAAAVCLLASLALAQEPAPEPAPGFEPTLEDLADLPAGPGQEETFYTCTACHGLALVKSQGTSRERWNDTISLMVRVHEMPEPSPEERELIASYLAEHFPPKQQQQRGWKNPFLKQ